jgi:hypothetical protein
MAKAINKATTEWVRYSRAKKLVCNYLGWDAETVDRELLKRLEAEEIRWRGRFNATPEYSGPGLGDRNFFKLDDPNQLMTRDGPLMIIRLRGVHVKGDTATRIDGAVVEDMEVALEDFVRLKLLAAHDADAPAKKTRGKKTVRRLSPIQILARKEFPPNGKPPDEMSTPRALRRFEKRIQQHNISAPADEKITASDDTIKRAIGRR